MSGYGPTTAVLAAILAIPLLFVAVASGGVAGVTLVLAAVGAVGIAVSVAFGSAEDAADDAEAASEPAAASQDDVLDEYCPRCGQTIPADADHCEDCSVVGSWRK